MGLAGLLLLVASCSGSSVSESEMAQSPEGKSPTDRPNIVFVLADDLDYALTQKMPNLHSLLVEEGTSFENAFVSYPLCCPSRATILTGLYAHNHNVKGNELPEGGFETFRDEGHEENTIAARLQEEGYRTALFGKYLNEYPGDDPTYVPPGWDEWYGKLNEQKRYDYELNENGEVVSYGRNPEDFFTDVLSSKATDFVRRAAEDTKPFFMFVAPLSPHLPATPAKRYKDAFAEEEAPRPPSFNEEDVSDKPSYIQDTERFDGEETSEIDERYRKRLRSMLGVEEMVASLIEELEVTGELENTFVIFTSDNGYVEGQHRMVKGKFISYEESARVPLFVKGPGIAPGSKVENLILNTDFAPTFADLAGVEVPADGRSLTPLLRGEDPSLWRSNILLEGFDSKGTYSYAAVRTKTHKYVEYDIGERELYDLQADPYELESLHGSADPSALENLKAKLDALRGCSKEGCWDAEDVP